MSVSGRWLREMPGRPALAALLLLAVLAPAATAADPITTIARVRGSIVGVGTYERTRAPPFQFRGTGFAIADGTVVATNAHVLPTALDAARSETLAIAVPAEGDRPVTIREVTRLATDPGSDLALLKLKGEPLIPLKLRDSELVREGQEILMTGYPLGAVLGPVPATHRGMVAAVTPIAIPQGRAGDLDPALVRRLATGSFPVFQLDATAYPGNSGSPIYDPVTGDVLGIVNMVFVKGTKETALIQPSGITYAMPSNHLAALLNGIPRVSVGK
jgi:S1-C subfamily serine protease